MFEKWQQESLDSNEQARQVFDCSELSSGVEELVRDIMTVPKHNYDYSSLEYSGDAESELPPQIIH